ncbi:protein kinase domain-containing protein [Occultella gossypii]|uniref:non-specific serine/threonine protein kinase n=1 Tax=Occultella gossypii TaxID=2800820 RepID=A0ABS7SAW4_9MICO|nr:protein kinase [Occultella gossypii]MBZ2197494.1 serine/threonine protein kinase [Occultella gossypii]
MSAARVLGGRYELRDVLGRGGMAVVHLARDIRLERWVAVKLLRAELARDPQFRCRFQREAQTVARLDHPGIVSVYDVGEHVDDSRADEPSVPFIVMEYVAGQSLRARLGEGALTLKESIQYQVGVLSALEFSHRAGVVHRDIKPANVMVTPDSRIKVVDFGIARVGSDAAATATQTHALLGTAQYLSPEQVRGEIADARSDLYSAGCLLYELLTGRPPFVGENPVAVAYQHVHQDPLRASDHRTEVTPALDTVLLTALAKDRNDRYQSARSFRQALQSALKGLVLTHGCADTDALDNAVPFRPPWHATTMSRVSTASRTGQPPSPRAREEKATTRSA